MVGEKRQWTRGNWYFIPCLLSSSVLPRWWPSARLQRKLVCSPTCLPLRPRRRLPACLRLRTAHCRGRAIGCRPPRSLTLLQRPQRTGRSPLRRYRPQAQRTDTVRWQQRPTRGRSCQTASPMCGLKARLLNRQLSLNNSGTTSVSAPPPGDTLALGQPSP